MIANKMHRIIKLLVGCGCALVLGSAHAGAGSSGVMTCDLNFETYPASRIHVVDNRNGQDTEAPISMFMKIVIAKEDKVCTLMGGTATVYGTGTGGPLVFSGYSSMYLTGVDQKGSFADKLYDMIMTAVVLKQPITVSGEASESIESYGYLGQTLINRVVLK